MALLLTINGCKRITITDSIWYGSLGSQGATQIHTLASPAPVVITLEQFATLWDDLSNPMICTSATTFATWKENIEKLCSFDNVCSYNDTEAVSQAVKTINSVSKQYSKALKDSLE
jgi:hypothetical protein